MKKARHGQEWRRQMDAVEDVGARSFVNIDGRRNASIFEALSARRLFRVCELELECAVIANWSGLRFAAICQR